MQNEVWHGSMIDDCEIQNETFSRERQQNAARRTCSVIKMSALCRRKRTTSEEVPLSTRAQDASQDGKDPINHARTESVSTSVETETETETERERVCGSSVR